MKSTLIVLTVLVIQASAKVNYAGHKVVRVIPETVEQLQHLNSLDSYDFWSGPSFLGSPAHIRVSPEQFGPLQRSLSTVNSSFEVVNSDVGKLIADEERNLLQKAIPTGRDLEFASYHTFDELMNFLDTLSSSNPLISTSVIGTTSEGRKIIMATISNGSSTNKPVLYFDCAMHAREWVTAASCVWMINQLVTQYGVDSNITTLVDAFEWKITPVSNPDGYVYTWTNDRLWRKNRQRAPGSIFCLGTDPNRNFDAGFGGPGTSSSPCSEIFHGPSAFSSPEAAAMRDVLTANRGRVKAVVSVHAFSQFWMSPYGYKAKLPEDYTEMARVMDIAVGAVEATYGTRFKHGNIAQVIYLAAGSTVDYAYDKEGIVYSYAIEARDTGRYGFVLPADQIIPSATELFNGFKAMALEIQKTL